MNPKVKAWMESNNFKWHDSLQIYYQPQNIRFGFVNPLHATFMYRQYLQGKLEELRKVCCCDVKPVDSKNGINVCYNEHGDRITQLEAELKELEEKK